MQHDLELAREIQVGLLPKETPDVAGFDIFGWGEACDETGGDYYDYIPMEDGRLGLVIADVTGHGIGPALLMAEARAFARSAASFGGSVDCVLCKVNDLLAADLGGGRFVTLFWGILDTAGGTLEYGSAGHGHVVVYHAADDSLEELESTAPPLGIMTGLDFPVKEARPLQPGDVLLMTTDGIEEAMNPAGDEFGRGALRDVLKKNAAKMSCDVAQAIRDEVRAFMGDAQQRDDLTMVVVKAL
jgi:serine phosphatase RsbU (regulator of sigma subunit)